MGKMDLHEMYQNLKSGNKLDKKLKTEKGDKFVKKLEKAQEIEKQLSKKAATKQ